MLNIPNPYVILIKCGVVLGLFFGAGAVGYHIRGLRADKDIAAIELKHSQAIVTAQAKAQAAEKVYLDKIYTLGEQNEQAKQANASKRTELVHSLRLGTIQLRDEWTQGCPTSLPHDPQTPAQLDAASELRNEGAGDLIENADNADADLRAWQAYGKAVSEAASGR